MRLHCSSCLFFELVQLDVYIFPFIGLNFEWEFSKYRDRPRSPDQSSEMTEGLKQEFEARKSVNLTLANCKRIKTFLATKNYIKSESKSKSCTIRWFITKRMVISMLVTNVGDNFRWWHQHRLGSDRVEKSALCDLGKPAIKNGCARVKPIPQFLQVS